MNYFKSLLLTAFALLAFAACDTDDLRDDVDNLKGRVESLEAQVTLLNDNMTAIKRLLEGGQTITNVVENDGTYTITLFDNSTITLTQGVKGEGKLPKITVVDGYWVVEGVQLKDMNGNPVRAEGATGEAGTTPKFQISDENNYWQISYDGGTTWKDVEGKDGKPVSAVSTGGGSSSDTFFQSASVDENKEFFIITLKDGDTYSIPIDTDLLCEIIKKEILKGGYWEFSIGETLTTKVKVKGDNVMVTAPAGWVATISEADPINHEATLTITAPANASAVNTRATADNSCDVTVQVNKGANWAVDKIQVKLLIIRDYYTMFNDGEDIEICGITINKSKYSDANVVALDGSVPALDIYFTTSMAKPNILFLSGEQEFTVNGYKAISNDLIIIGRYDNEKPIFKNLNASGTLRPQKGSLYLLNLHIAMEGNTSTAGFITNNDLKTENNCNNLAIDNCYFSGVLKPLYCDNKAANGINNIHMQNNKIQLKAAINLFQLTTATNLAGYKTFDFTNNLVYSENAVNSQFMNGTTDTSTSSNGIIAANIKNNTIINIIGANVYFRFQTGTSLNMNKNIFYIADGGKESYLYSFLFKNNPDPTIDVSDNIVYSPAGGKWSYYHSKSVVKEVPNGEINQMTLSDNSPIISFDYTNGIFTRADNMIAGEYGASIN